MSLADSFPGAPRRDPHAALRTYGWSAHWAAAFTQQPPLAPARVISQHLGAYVLATADGPRPGRVRGTFHGGSPEAMPAVGDWVAVEPGDGAAVISSVLPRRSCLVRPASGTVPQLQVIAANVDRACIVCSLDHDFSLSRLERYLVGMADTGAALALALTKADLHPDPESARAEARAISGSTPVLLLSARTGAGMDELRALLAPGQTAAFIGSSGVGKSTLVNALLGEARQETETVRAHDHGGRHCTTARQLIPHPDGWLLLDTPGVRELRLFYDAANAEAGFPDIAGLAASCRFRDCAHQGEPGCAIAEAIADGRLEARRLASYRKIARELAGRERFEERRARTVERHLGKGRGAPRQRRIRDDE